MVFLSAPPTPSVRVVLIRSLRKNCCWIWPQSATNAMTSATPTRTAYCTHRIRWARLRGDSFFFGGASVWVALISSPADLRGHGPQRRGATAGRNRTAAPHAARGHFGASTPNHFL